MKTLSVAILLFVVLASVLGREKEQIKEALKKSNDVCNSDPATKLTKDELKNWSKNHDEKPANLGSHARCVAQNMGWMANGKIVMDTVKPDIQTIFADRADEILQKHAVEKDTEEHTAMNLLGALMKFRKHDDHDDHDNEH